jgi:isopentenyl-diphosphate delta-isomerase
MNIRKQRKTEHLNIALATGDGPCTSGMEDIHLINNSVPELDLADISTRSLFLGKTLEYPILVNALTGGTVEGYDINLALARVADKYGLAMAVGSQKIAINDGELKKTFNIVRKINPDGLILANLSATSGIKEINEAINMIGADAIQLHFNIPQELAMQEGERCFRGILDNVSRIADNAPVPIIAKEVGFGFSREAVSKLFAAGVRIFDTGGKGGTNFIAIEDQRRGKFQGELDDWGITTAASLAEITTLKLPITTIASGGIRGAGDAVKALTLGAELVGMASPFLKPLMNGGPELLQEYAEGFLYRLKSVFLMAGAGDCKQLRTCPLVITGPTAEWLRARGIDPNWWAHR